MDPVLENTKKLMQQALDQAKKADRLHRNGVRRLASFPLLVRLLHRAKFSSLNKTIANHEWDRFANTSVALNLSRRIKFYERRKRQLEDELRRKNIHHDDR